MDKQILTAIVRNDESEPLPFIEPFYFTFIHSALLQPAVRLFINSPNSNEEYTLRDRSIFLDTREKLWAKPEIVNKIL
jgi:hypothetical protein